VVARALYLDNDGSFSNGRGLPPPAHHYDQRIMEAALTANTGAALRGISIILPLMAILPSLRQFLNILFPRYLNVSFP